jgi:RND superfamily putative drug exporter
MRVTEKARTGTDAAGDANRRRRAGWWLVPALLVVGWLGLGGWLGGLGGKINEVADSSTAGYLPRSAESSEVIELSRRFAEQDATPAFVVYHRPGGLSAADQARLREDIGAIRRELGGVLTGPPAGPVRSADGEAAQLVVPFAGSDLYKLGPDVQRLRDLVGRGSAGSQALTVHVAGPAGVQADLNDALGGIDLMLVLVTGAVILVILVVVYRSPLLPLLVLAVAGTALGVTQGVIYLLATHGVISISSDVQGILNVLVLGAGTDYALLLVSRFREELRAHRHRSDALRVAWRASLGPIAASAGTVGLGLLCLLVSDLGLNRDLGPAGAIGIGCAFLAMVSFLPGLLALFGRVAFWPFRPTFASRTSEGQGRWALLADWVGRRPRAVWVGTGLLLGALALGVTQLQATGVPDSEQVISADVQSKLGQQVLSAHFPAGAGNPAVVIARADEFGPVTAAARNVPGVASVQPFTGDRPAAAGSPAAGSPAAGSPAAGSPAAGSPAAGSPAAGSPAAGSPAAGSPAAEPVVIDGMAQLHVTLADAPDSPAAASTVQRLRDALRDLPAAEAKVGGYTAVQADFNSAAERDRIVMPLLLLVIFIVLALLLRALVAPILLIATVVLSYLAAIGVSAVVFQDLFDFPGVNATYPLHAFVFLVALGVDYNIFLMTRVREEAQAHGTRQGTLRGLALTGGVITSAGVVLAATFSALAVIPLVLLVELAFTVAFGVLLDTFLVRSLLVPALVLTVGPWVWWPSRLSRVREENLAEPAPEATASSDAAATAAAGGERALTR